MLPYLKYFHQVAESSSFSKAAKKLYMSQPALSRQIAALEKELGLPVFSRQGHSVALTEAGRRLYTYSQKILELQQQAIKEITELKDLSTGELTIGAGNTVANYMLASPLSVFSHRHPGIKVNLKVASSAEVVEAVTNNEIDMGITAGVSTFSDKWLFAEKFAVDELFLVVSGHHYLADTPGIINAEMLSKETFLFPQEGSSTRMYLEEFLEEKGIQPATVFYMESIESIKNGVINNLGTALLSRHAWENEFKYGVLKPLSGYNVKRPLNLVYLKNTRLSPAALMFAATLKKYYYHSNELMV